VTNADYQLKPGMTANVSIIIAQRENVLTVPNGALRFRVPDNALLLTNTAAKPNAPATNAARFAGGSGGFRGGGRARGERPVFHTVYVLVGKGDDPRLQPAQIKTGISDGISTEVLSGLDEGAQVVTGLASANTRNAAGPTPPFGAFPRMR